MENIIYIVPNGWRWVKLNDVCDIIMGQSPPSNTYHKEPIGLPFFQGKADFGLHNPIATTWCSAPTKTAEPGDILLSVRAPVGPTNIADTKCCIGRGLSAIRPTQKSDRDFILFAIKYREKYLSNMGSGSTFEAIRRDELQNFKIPLPQLNEQRLIATWLKEKLKIVERLHQLSEEQFGLVPLLIHSLIRGTLNMPTTKKKLGDCLVEIKVGIGKSWQKYPVIGATRNGVAPAKEKVGKNPERYKLVEPGIIFYNPMRINIGSIGMLDEGDEPGITSPDYVVFKSIEGIIHPRWFYYWFRSSYGETFIKGLTRGAVRERMLFNRLKDGEIYLPSWEAQSTVANKLLKIKAIESNINSQLAEINHLPASFLRQAFSGAI